ncbi:hypothetical protein OGAPHI_002633 [Ogataea philodendri]|uniref:t-SNARE coiled-coil homology domain-containing protein n=1 Tax=Ogataea philodendri TaxID=1378263 RepID=A0A9P8PB06_9ASCO|nr:uncharacterized protein OGAPHI_002633 [Ogataea philodendri]KAH3668878.1 hypothetical protein OGAPHI_002633 [Ogataea philodendri]
MKAGFIAKDIARVTSSLGKLAVLAKQKQLFNDKPTDMIELTYVIKQDIFKIERSLKDLQQSSASKSSGDSQINTYTKNVVQLLNTKVKNVSETFKEVLQTRQRNELAQKSRQEQLLATVNGSSHDPSKNNAANDLVPYALRNKGAQVSDNPFLSAMDQDPDVSVPNQDYLSIPDQSQQLMLLEEQSNQYLQERNRAVEAIESTINEVGGLFQQLATMVQEQGEVIQRIDNNVEDISLNISGAQRELLKYYNTVTSNRCDNALHVVQNVVEGVELGELDVLLDAELDQILAPSGKQQVARLGRRQVRHTVSAVEQVRFFAQVVLLETLFDRFGLVVPERSVVAVDNVPVIAVGLDAIRDYGHMVHNLLSEQLLQQSFNNWRHTTADNVDRDPVGVAPMVELGESRVQLDVFEQISHTLFKRVPVCWDRLEHLVKTFSERELFLKHEIV